LLSDRLRWFVIGVSWDTIGLARTQLGQWVMTKVPAATALRRSELKIIEIRTS
jgi:hypothetical protein